MTGLKSGRRYYADFITDTVLLSKQFGRPVKTVWSREDDVRHGYFRPASVQRVQAAARDGRISHWHQKVANHPREIYLERDGSPAETGNYEFPAGFVPNLLFDYVAVPARIPLGQWRATEHSSNVFVVSGAIDELAHAAEIDPLEFWLGLMGDDQFVQVREDFRFDASRLRHVIEVAAEKAHWGTPLPSGKGRGIAASYNQVEGGIVDSSNEPRGLGEGPLPPVAPAVTNAIFAATGKRIRELPIQL